MKPYIDLNTELRKKATSDFEKDLYKLMNNSVYGKTMVNLLNRKDIELVKSWDRCQKLVNKPLFNSFTKFNKNLVAIKMKKTTVKMNKPILVGQTLSDLSKTLMYDFHYNTMKKKYGDDAQLLFTDIDSFCHEIKTYDIYNDMKKITDLFDTSNYPKNYPLYSEVNKEVIGKFKDECGGKDIEEFVGLRAKLYAYKVGNSEEKKCKGIAKNVEKKTISIKDYKTVLFERSIIHGKMMRFQSNIIQYIRDQ